MVYDPEMDVSIDLSPDAASYSQFIIDILRWMVEFGSIYIITKLLLLSLHLTLLRERHLVAAVDIMMYMCQKYNSRLVYDLT